MELETFYSLLFLAALGYWCWHANRSEGPSRPASSPAVSPPTDAAAPPAAVKAARASPEDAFLAEAERVRHEEERNAREEAARYNAEVEAAVKREEQLKERLSRFAKQNNLDSALTELHDAIKHFPAWSKRPNWEQLNYLGLTEVSGEFRGKDQFSGPVTVYFSYAGHRYGLTAESWSGDEESYVDLTLSEDGEEVFGVSAQVADNEYCTIYRPCDVKAFKRRGDWAATLIKLQARMKLRSEKFKADMRRKAGDEIRARFAE